MYKIIYLKKLHSNSLLYNYNLWSIAIILKESNAFSFVRLSLIDRLLRNTSWPLCYIVSIVIFVSDAIIWGWSIVRPRGRGNERPRALPQELAFIPLFESPLIYKGWKQATLCHHSRHHSSFQSAAPILLHFGHTAQIFTSNTTLTAGRALPTFKLITIPTFLCPIWEN